MTPRLTPAAALLLALSGGLQAQGRDTVRLPEIVVTATRSAVPSDRVPASVTVLSGDALRARGIHTLAEALREVAGAQVTPVGSFGGQTSMFLRGGESDYVRVLVDGVPLNQPGGAIDLANVTTDEVDRIEIVRGPGSVLYGSDAMTGVIQIFTRRAVSGAATTLEAAAGTWDWRELRGRVSAGSAKGGVTAGASRIATDGVYAFNNRYRREAASAALHAAPDEATTLSLHARLTDGSHHYPTDGSGAPVDSNQVQTGRTTLLSAEVSRRVMAGLRLSVLLTDRRSRDDIDDAPDGPSDTLGFFAYRSSARVRRSGAEIRASMAPSSAVTLTLGGAVERQRERSWNASLSQFGPDSGTTDVRRDNRAVFAQLLAQAGRAMGQTGIRLDDNERFGRFTTLRVAGSYALTGGLRVRAAAGTAFKEPTFFETYATGFVAGNPALRPERSASWEAGMQVSALRRRAWLDVVVFGQRFRDMIQYTFTPPTPGGVNYVNVAGAEARGLEAELRVSVARPLEVAVRWSWIHTISVDSGFDGAQFAIGRRLLRRPTHAALLVATARPSASLRGDVALRFTGSRDDLDFSAFPASRVRLGSHLRTDVSAMFALSGGAALTARIENVLNADYAEAVGFPGRGRLALVGVRWGIGRSVAGGVGAM